MRKVLFLHAAVRDEGAFNGSPPVQVDHLEQWPDQD
jgi:hypothetical protein